MSKLFGGASRLSFDYLAGRTARAILEATVRPPAFAAALPGYLHPSEGALLYWLAGRIPAGGQVLEVGSFKGKSAAYLAAGLRARGATLHCVDVWTNRAMPYDPPQDVFAEFERNVALYRDRIRVHRGTSADIASGWRVPLDLLFIDGDHSY